MSFFPAEREPIRVDPVSNLLFTNKRDVNPPRTPTMTFVRRVIITRGIEFAFGIININNTRCFMCSMDMCAI